MLCRRLKSPRRPRRVVEALGVRVPRYDAEATRRRLLELGMLRIDLEVARQAGDVVFPVLDTSGPRLPTAPFDFAERAVRPDGYQDLLPQDLRAAAPRAFDSIGDVVVVKVPDDLWPRRADIGQAILEFHAARAVFADHGVVGPFRVRRLERIAGLGGSLTQVRENGVVLWVDPAAAYYSPRLASERARVAAQVQAGEHVIDLFAGVAPFAVQIARRGAMVNAVDINPEAVKLAQRNAAENGVAERVRLHSGDARAVAADLLRADRVIMNLPHGARSFLDVAARLLKPAATLHYHEILEPEQVSARSRAIEEELANLGWKCRVTTTRTVRNYSPREAHIAFDIVGAP